MLTLLSALLLTLLQPATTGERAEVMPVLPERERAALRNALLEDRLENLLPGLMEARGIDLWVLVAREYNEDPVVETMLPATWLSARRRTILVFAREGDEVRRYAVARYPVGTMFPSAWNPEEEPDQWAALAALIEGHDPQAIGINVSEKHGLADGLSHQQHQELMAALPKKLRGRVRSADQLALDWLETRTQREMEVYPRIVRIAHDIIDEAFSEAVITPGETTTDDVRWWMRDKVTELGMEVWFHPSVTIQRAEREAVQDAAKLKPDEVIRPGDLLWVDFGITYLGLNTDTQQHTYVLRPGETEAPEGLREGLAALNRTTDHLTEAFEVGRKSNDILKAARRAATGEGLRPSYYSHGIGYHGHGGGSPIGWWDDQGTDHPMGYRPLRPMTAWSIELNNAFAVAEWGGQDVSFRAEEEAFFDGETVRFMDGRQTRFHLIPSATE
ncbi:M24 family metallopeptidase [Parvularcula maris]|uniref:M24 family metallopeptidase n=1 Tax=Parvularcula maris TaxID=2965077 RepID=A0A9X2L6R9_9PROT|nr:M24 family metallopeptidase [Parvularcula maris]MCQ8184118.1 M24 family metallopeptidase [Parvularcula maris]